MLVRLRGGGIALAVVSSNREDVVRRVLGSPRQSTASGEILAARTTRRNALALPNSAAPQA
jgi:hypothetical protein